MAASTVSVIISAAIPLADTALRVIAAANAGNLAEAQSLLASARQNFDAASSELDRLLQEENPD